MERAEADSRSSPPGAAVSRYGPVVLRSRSGGHELGTVSAGHRGRPARRAHRPHGQSRRHRPLWLIRGTSPSRAGRTKASRPSRGRRGRGCRLSRERGQEVARATTQGALSSPLRPGTRGGSTRRGRALPDLIVLGRARRSDGPKEDPSDLPPDERQPANLSLFSSSQPVRLRSGHRAALEGRPFGNPDARRRARDRVPAARQHRDGRAREARADHARRRGPRLRRPRPARGRPGHREDRARAGDRAVDRGSARLPDPVHARPAADRRDRPLDLQPARAGLRVQARARCSPTSSSSTRSTARCRRRSPRCSRRWPSSR